MRFGMNWIKILFINALVLFALFGALFLSPPAVFYVKNSFVYLFGGEHVHEIGKSAFHIYDDFNWAEKHFNELNAVHASYHDYVVWKRSDFSGETISVRDGFRRTIPSLNDTFGDEYWFFGGSTTWGSGVDDANTYPSLVAAKFNVKVRNFGEPGYIARQSLASLTNEILLSKKSNDRVTVVFYDGVNDVLFRCALGMSDLGTSSENIIRNRTGELEAEEVLSYEKTFHQIVYMMRKINEKLAPDVKDKKELYVCHNNPERAKKIAETLVLTWKQAKNLAEANNMSFLAVLQPVAYWGNPNIDYLNLTHADDVLLKKQYEAIYPLIIEEVKKHGIDFLDLTSLYDGCDDCYIDFCHVGPQAHHRLATALGETLRL